MVYFEPGNPGLSNPVFIYFYFYFHLPGFAFTQALKDKNE